jgi:hypothetical protein
MEDYSITFGWPSFQPIPCTITVRCTVLVMIDNSLAIVSHLRL